MLYDPMVQPDPEQWGALSETEQLEAVLAFHHRARIQLPNAALHATFHTIVENQALLGAATPVAETIQRLMTEGLSRHGAIHAVGMVLASHMHDVVQGSDMPRGDSNAPYYDALRQLTAARWREQLE